MKIVKTIGAGIGVVLCFLFLGCGSVPMVAAGVPDIQQVLPLPLVAGSSGATLKVLGANFDSGSKILWNGTELSTTVVDSSTLSTPVESANLAVPGDVQLAVKNSLSGRISPAVRISINSNGSSSSAISVTTTSIPAGSIGTPYSATLAASGGSGAYTWSIANGKLPAGITLNASTGILDGTPTASGSFSFNVTATDNSSHTQSKSAGLTLTISAVAISIDAISFPSATPGVSYSQQMNVIGGTPNYHWSITAGALPGGLSLSPAKGVISGTPTTPGLYTFTLSVKDSESPAQVASAQFTISVTGNALEVVTSSLPVGQGGISYSQLLQATGGTPGYQWRIASGALPPGLSLNQTTGAISGMPTQSGTSTFTAAVSDSSNPTLSASSTLSLTVAAPALAISTPSLPALTVGTSYSQTLQATGGTTPYSWSLASGQLPPGLSLSSGGVISGSISSASSSYTYSFSVKVTDSSSSVQTATAPASIALVVSASPLSITSSTLASGTSGSAYSASLQATGGTPGYSWRISTGSLPAGLTLAASTGAITGTPTTSGTSSFTATVSDNGNPVQTQSVNTSITVAAAAQSSSAPQGPGTYWFVRPDGGTRYSANQTAGQCDGKSDVAYPGTGTNQHCAFNDVRYMWMDGTYGNSAWVMAGGDTLVIRGCAALASQVNSDAPHCRIGWDKGTGNDSQNFWCAGVSAWWGCSMPPPPSGTASQHTRILGACAYGTYTCNPVVGYPYTNNNLTQLFGGFAVGAVMYLSGSSYVDVEGLEITSHNGGCTRVGAPAYPAGCSTMVPVSDFASWGIVTTNPTSNITLQDLYIHGLSNLGIGGPLGGAISLTRVSVDFNAFAGWNFDDGYSTPNAPGSSITQSYVTMIGNGCLEEYPIVHTQFPAKACWDSNSGGFGDAWSGQNTTLDSFTCDHCNISYNTKDAAMGPHTIIHNLSLTNSIWVGNMGQAGKWGQDKNSTFLLQNNLIVGNCMRMSQQVPGAAQNFAKGSGLPGSYLTNFCRAAGSLFDYFADSGSSININNNSIVTYQPTVFQLGCETANNCAGAPYKVANNLILAYISPTALYNQGMAPAIYYFDDPSVVISPSNNIEYGTRNGDACGVNAVICSDPLLMNELAQGTFSSESSLDNFNFHPSSISPALGAGVTIPGLTTDYFGIAIPAAPTIGAVAQ